MDIVLRLINATSLPAACLLAVFGSRPARPDHTWTGIVALLILWSLRRVCRAFDDTRPYPMRTLKLCGWLLAFGAVERVLASFTL